MTVDVSPSSESARLSARIAQHGGKSRRVYMKAGVFLFLALLAGMAIGVSATVLYFKNRMRRPPRPSEIGTSIVQQMSDYLELNSSEREAVKSVVAARMKKVEEIRKESWTSIRGQFDILSEETKEIIGEDRYAKWAAERDRRLGERKNLHGDGPKHRAPRH